MPTRQAYRKASVASWERWMSTSASRPVVSAPTSPRTDCQCSVSPLDQRKTRNALSKDLGVRRLVEPDQERAATAQDGRAEVAGGTDQQALERRAVGLLAPEVDVDHLLAPGRVQLVHACQHVQRPGPGDRGLLGVDLGRHHDLLLRKEPLRLGAGLSARAVIAPVDSSHAMSSRNRERAWPISAGESSCTKWLPRTVTSRWLGQARQDSRWAPTRIEPGSALTKSFGVVVVASHWP